MAKVVERSDGPRHAKVPAKNSIDTRCDFGVEIYRDFMLFPRAWRIVRAFENRRMVFMFRFRILNQKLKVQELG